jgi:hypothetical protein
MAHGARGAARLSAMYINMTFGGNTRIAVCFP